MITNLEYLPILISRICQQKIKLTWFLIRTIFYIHISLIINMNMLRKIPILLDHTIFLMFMFNCISAIIFGIIIVRKNKEFPN
jgi:hypothetical protein